MGLSPKQIAYLYAIGVFKSKGGGGGSGKGGKSSLKPKSGGKVTVISKSSKLTAPGVAKLGLKKAASGQFFKGGPDKADITKISDGKYKITSNGTPAQIKKSLETILAEAKSGDVVKVGHKQYQLGYAGSANLIAANGQYVTIAGIANSTAKHAGPSVTSATKPLPQKPAALSAKGQTAQIGGTPVVLGSPKGPDAHSQFEKAVNSIASGLKPGEKSSSAIEVDGIQYLVKKDPKGVAYLEGIKNGNTITKAAFKQDVTDNGFQVLTQGPAPKTSVGKIKSTKLDNSSEAQLKGELDKIGKDLYDSSLPPGMINPHAKLLVDGEEHSFINFPNGHALLDSKGKFADINTMSNADIEVVSKSSKGEQVLNNLPAKIAPANLPAVSPPQPAPPSPPTTAPPVAIKSLGLTSAADGTFYKGGPDKADITKISNGKYKITSNGTPEQIKKSLDTIMSEAKPGDIIKVGQKQYTVISSLGKFELKAANGATINYSSAVNSNAKHAGPPVPIQSSYGAAPVPNLVPQQPQQPSSQLSAKSVGALATKADPVKISNSQFNGNQKGQVLAELMQGVPKGGASPNLKVVVDGKEYVPIKNQNGFVLLKDPQTGIEGGFNGIHVGKDLEVFGASKAEIQAAHDKIKATQTVFTTPVTSLNNSNPPNVKPGEHGAKAVPFLNTGGKYDTQAYENPKYAKGMSSADSLGRSQLGTYKEPGASDNILPQSPEGKKMYSALASYQGSGYGPINAALRSGMKNVDPDTKSKIDAIDQAFAKHAKALSEPVVVYRGVGSFSSKITDMVTNGQLKVGDTIEDKGYMSTALHAGSSFSGVKFQITAPKGKKGIFMGENYETEVLFDRNSKIRIGHIEQNGLHLIIHGVFED